MKKLILATLLFALPYAASASDSSNLRCWSVKPGFVVSGFKNYAVNGYCVNDAGLLEGKMLFNTKAYRLYKNGCKQESVPDRILSNVWAGFTITVDPSAVAKCAAGETVDGMVTYRPPSGSSLTGETRSETISPEKDWLKCSTGADGCISIPPGSF